MVTADGRNTETEAGSAAALPHEKGLAGGGALLWCGMVSLGLSTVVLLAVLSRHLHAQGFVRLSTVFGVLFIASLIPSGIPFRAAALIADGSAPPNYSRRNLAPWILAGLAISPLLSYLLGLSILAVALIVAQVAVAFPLAVRRGALIAFRRFTALGTNLLIEATCRVALGCLAGLLWGVTGLVAGLAIATVLALVILPATPPKVAEHPRPLTPLFDTWFAVVLLGVLVQMDILLAAHGLSKTAATQYDLAAVPSKGVFLVLAAASTLVFPYVRARADRRVVFIGALTTMGLGFLVTIVLFLFRDLVGQVLGQDAAQTWLLLSLCCAMSLAGATGVFVSCDVALGITRPWPPLLLGLIALIACWLARPTAHAFAAAVLCVQAGTLLLSLWVCLKGNRGESLSADESALPTRCL